MIILVYYQLHPSSTVLIVNQSINQSINQFFQKCDKHWTGHQGRMQPPLTGVHKNNVSNSVHLY